MAVRTPHTISSQIKGDINHLGTDFEPAPAFPLRVRWFGSPQPVSGEGPLSGVIIDPLARGWRDFKFTRPQTANRHLISGYGPVPSGQSFCIESIPAFAII